MKSLPLSLGLCALLSLSAHAEEWNPAPMLAVALTAHAADWKQTRWISDACHGRIPDLTAREKNPILGPCPSAAHVNQYFLGTAVLLSTLAYILPPEYAKPMVETWAVVEIGVVGRNAYVGVRFSK